MAKTTYWNCFGKKANGEKCGYQVPHGKPLCEVCGNEPPAHVSCPAASTAKGKAKAKAGAKGPGGAGAGGGKTGGGKQLGMCQGHPQKGMPFSKPTVCVQRLHTGPVAGGDVTSKAKDKQIAELQQQLKAALDAKAGPVPLAPAVAMELDADGAEESKARDKELALEEKKERTTLKAIDSVAEESRDSIFSDHAGGYLGKRQVHVDRLHEIQEQRRRLKPGHIQVAKKSNYVKQLAEKVEKENATLADLDRQLDELQALRAAQALVAADTEASYDIALADYSDLKAQYPDVDAEVEAEVVDVPDDPIAGAVVAATRNVKLPDGIDAKQVAATLATTLQQAMQSILENFAKQQADMQAARTSQSGIDGSGAVASAVASPPRAAPTHSETGSVAGAGVRERSPRR